jgi:anthranilate synthase component 1
LLFARAFLLQTMQTLPKIILSQKPTYIKLADDMPFFSLFQVIEQSFDTCFILESLGVDEAFSRYSLIGFDPAHIISGNGKELKFDEESYIVENPYFALREIMPPSTIARNYAGGLVGYMGYEAVNFFEPALDIKRHDSFDQFMFGAYLDGLIYDKLTNELFYFYYTTNRIEVVKQLLKRKITKQTISISEPKDTITRKEHERVVAKVKEHILAGDIFQCEVGFKTKYKISGDTLQIYAKLREVNPSPFMYYVKFSDTKIIGASPELLFSLRDGDMTTKPLAGTIRRGKDAAEDQKLARMLLHDPKEIAEHNMLVDLHRNDIGKVAKFGTVKVKDLMSVKKFSHVQHISSEITGIIDTHEDMFSALASNFPAGTLSGAPKIEAMKIINANEPEARGPYGGAVGHFGFNGDCTFAIAIRSLFVHGEDAYAQTSGGIVYDSEAEKEYDEIERKLEAMKKVLKGIGGM